MDGLVLPSRLIWDVEVRCNCKDMLLTCITFWISLPVHLLFHASDSNMIFPLNNNRTIF